MNETLRYWVVCRTWAVPVRFVLSEADEIDPLERAILSLCRIRPRFLSDLVELLNFHAEMVESAVTGLSERGWLVADGERLAVGMAFGEATESPGIPQPGWVVLDPRTGHPIPRLWVGDRAPHGRPKNRDEFLVTDLNDYIDYEEPGKLSDQLLQGYLSSLCLGDGIPCLAPPSSRKATHPNSTDAPDTETIEEPSMSGDGPGALDSRSAYPPGGNEGILSATYGEDVRARSLFLDTSWKPGHKRGWEKVSCRIAVDFVPRIVGPATCITHEPELSAAPFEIPSLPVSDAWLHYLPVETRTIIDAHAQRLAQGRSIVLQSMGISSEEELLALVDAHFSQCAFAYGRPILDLSPSEETVEAAIRYAQEWLIGARREGKLHLQARLAYGLAVETLCKNLAAWAHEPLNEWARMWKGLPKGARTFTDMASRSERLARYGLYTCLGNSRQHLEEACERPERLLSSLSREDLGAGDNLLHWLLPLMLVDDSQVAAYAWPIQVATQQEPQLFGFLNDLIMVRNDIFHDRKGAKLAPGIGQPSFIDERLMKVWCAILAGRHLESQQLGAPSPRVSGNA